MITEQERIFLEKLKSDYISKKDSSFLNVLFSTSILDIEKVTKDILANIEDDDEILNIFEQSDFLLYTRGGFLLGKYQDFFWLYSNEGELWGAGKQIQNTCNIIRQLLYFTLDNINYIESMFKERNLPSYKKTVTQYKDFCQNMSLTFTESDTQWENESKHFDLMLQEKGIM